MCSIQMKYRISTPNESRSLQCCTHHTNTKANRYSDSLASTLKHMGQAFVHGRIRPKKHGTYSYTDKYPLHRIGKYSSGRIPTQKHGAGSIPWTSDAVSERWGEYTHRFWIFYEFQMQIVMVQQRTHCIYRRQYNVTMSLHSSGNNIWNKSKSAQQRAVSLNYVKCFFLKSTRSFRGIFFLNIFVL